jgi:sulfatase modifying factor 1
MRAFSYSAAAVVLLLFIAFAALWGHDPPRAPRDAAVEMLILQLGSEEFSEREAAKKELELLGERPLALLREAVVETKNPELRWRAEHLLQAPERTSPAIGLKLALIPAGEFQQGSPESEAGRREDETAHRVQISRAFYLGVYEVTQQEYEQVLKQNPSWFTKTAGGKEKVAREFTDRFPVERVSWFDALAFCNELSRLDHFQPYYQLDDIERQENSIRSARVTVRGGYGYRLPTEAEWEYACRARTATPFHHGGEGNGNLSNVKGVTIPGGYGGAIVGPNLQRTTRVGNYTANAWKLHDMHGNVGEWCFDVYDKEYYRVAPRKDPTGPAAGQHRVWRGGSWLVAESSCRSAARNFHTPDERKEYLGFRVARNP